MHSHNYEIYRGDERYCFLRIILNENYNKILYRHRTHYQQHLQVNVVCNVLAWHLWQRLPLYKALLNSLVSFAITRKFFGCPPFTNQLKSLEKQV